MLCSPKTLEDIMRVGEAGEVILPPELRRLLGIESGTELDFRLVGDVVEMRVSRRVGQRGQDVIKLLAGANYTGPNADELMAMTRGEPR